MTVMVAITTVMRMVYIELTTATVFSFRKSECVLVGSQPYFFVSTKLNKGNAIFF